MFEAIQIHSATEGSFHAPADADGAQPGAARRRPCGELPKWRMKRVVDYVDANFGQPVTLGDLAAVAKLTRMHFAAQFRAATGLRPHEYLLRRRIDEAKRLLQDDSLGIVEIALSVGFQTQAHFTTVFGRFVGDTPHRWRRAEAAGRTKASAPRRGAAAGPSRRAADVALQPGA